MSVEHIPHFVEAVLIIISRKLPERLRSFTFVLYGRRRFTDNTTVHTT